MATPVTMPKLGIIMVEGSVSRWLKQAGETVHRGEPLVEIATDKITYEMEAQEEGVLHLVALAGETVPVDGVLAYLLAPGETLPAGAAAPGPTPTQTTPAPPPFAGRAPAAERLRASPIARRAAREQGLDLARVQGTGPGGRIVYADVERAVASQVTAPAPTPLAEPLRVRQRIPIGGMRQLIAQRMMQSLATTAQVTLSTQADASHLVRIREQVSRLEEAAGRPRVPYDAILAKVVARALQDHPVLNSAVEGNEIIIFEEINIAVAVSVEEGLVAPVLHHVGEKSLPQISQELLTLVERARRRNLTLDDLTGGTFGLSNLGLYGVEAFTPILIPPQTGILGIGSIAERPIIEEGRLQVRETMHLSLTFDHRATDGVPAGRLLRRIRELIESPWMLFW